MRAIRDAIAHLQEITGADAILVSLTRCRRRKTETLVVPHGNAHTVRGLADYAYSQLCDESEEYDDGEETEEGKDSGDADG
tara:strand:- start:417 stop:659 length:243 start_codon:yes stop_codon:yes gene_type:complete